MVVPLSKKFQPVPFPPMERSEPGVVEPMPTLCESVTERVAYEAVESL